MSVTAKLARIRLGVEYAMHDHKLLLQMNKREIAPAQAIEQSYAMTRGDLFDDELVAKAYIRVIDHRRITDFERPTVPTDKLVRDDSSSTRITVRDGYHD